MAKRKQNKGKQKKKEVFNIDLAVIAMMVISVLLGFLIYTNSGYIGGFLSPVIGGVFGILKYIVPIGTFFIGIYLACDSKDYLFPKLVQYCLFLLFISTVMCIYEMSVGRLDINYEFVDLINAAYNLGIRNIGGGAIGAVIAVPLAKLLGTVGAVILSLGIAIIMLIKIFRINVSKIISDMVDNHMEREINRKEARRNSQSQKIDYERKERLRKARQEQLLREYEEKLRQKEARRNRKKTSIDIPIDDQIEMDFGFDDEPNIVENQQFDDEIVPLSKENKKYIKTKEQKQEQQSSPDYIDSNLFKKQEEVKEDKTKEVLVLEHALTVEDEHYEFPPIQLLSPAEQSNAKAGKKAIAENATRLQKTLYSFGVSAKVENVSIGPAITRYELKPAEGVRVSKIANLADDIALNLAAASIRIEAPIPGKQAVGIEVPNAENEVVHLREVIETDDFSNHKSNLAFALGKDVAGNRYCKNATRFNCWKHRLWKECMYKYFDYKHNI